MDNFRQAFDPDGPTPNRIFFAVDAADAATARVAVEKFLAAFDGDFLSVGVVGAFPMVFSGGALRDEILVFFKELFSAVNVFSVSIPSGVGQGAVSAGEVVAALAPKGDYGRRLEDVLVCAQDYILDSLHWQDSSTGVRFYNVSEQSFSLGSLLMRTVQVQERKWVVAVDLCWDAKNFLVIGH